MRLIAYAHEGKRRVGVHDADSTEVIDLADAVPKYTDMLTLVHIANALAAARKAAGRCRRVALTDIKLDAPIPRPDCNVFVNGELRQLAKIGDLISIPECISTISRGITLVPCDVTGTESPAGVGIGFNPPNFLTADDEVKIKIHAYTAN